MKNEITLEEIVTLTQQFIKIRSVADNIAALNEAIVLSEKRLDEFTIKNFSSYGKPSLLVHNTQPEVKNFKILLNAHLDIVQGKDSQFEPSITNGKLYGRGAYDMKAAASVIILLFKELANQVPYPLALQLTTDEEKGSHCAKT